MNDMKDKLNENKSSIRDLKKQLREQKESKDILYWTLSFSHPRQILKSLKIILKFLAFVMCKWHEKNLKKSFSFLWVFFPITERLDLL